MRFIALSNSTKGPKWGSLSFMQKIQLTLAVQTNGFSLVTCFGTCCNSLLTDSVTFFNSWVEGAKIAKSTFASTIKFSGTIGEEWMTRFTLALTAFAVIIKNKSKLVIHKWHQLFMIWTNCIFFDENILKWFVNLPCWNVSNGHGKA